ncbi:MAG: prepilin-type N-terminal cleavage/methylation domain-containing protein [Patescibacteria group bacterium]
MKHTKGFTLIELLIIIAIIAILAAVAFVSLDPLTRFRDSRDAARWSDISAVLTASKVDQVDNEGSYLSAIDSLTTSTNYMIGTAGSGCDATPCDVSISGSNCVDLTGLVTEGYLASVPISPNGSGSWDATLTGYYMVKSTTGALTVGACESENTTSISIQR